MSDKTKKNIKKPWGGRFAASSSDITERISASIQYDARLYRQDIRGSIAHARMLKKTGILTAAEFTAIEKGLGEIQKEIEEGRFEFSASLEDIHMNIEAALTERIGDAGRKLHTARSRNDQIALDLRLYLLDEAASIDPLLASLVAGLVSLAEEHIDAVMPGYTHLQVAQPVRFAQHILAHAWALLRDRERLARAAKACSASPLGAGAMAGVNYPTDRAFTAAELGLAGITPNSMDSVSDRDFALDFLYFAAVLGLHLSRFCEELVLWSTAEFGFIRLSDEVTTGSSIMPQKRNPDLAELIRGKSGRLYGNLIALLTMLKGLPLTYNRDLQEDKERVFDSVDTVKLSLEGMMAMIAGMKVNTDVMKQAVYRNYSTATDLADYLARKGVPFRQAHEIIGRLVRHCEEGGADFFSLPLQTLLGFSEHFGEDIVEILNPESSPERKLSAGSTARGEIERQIAALREALGG
ncbi:MAG: argininosuccinate lyase [Spirochaetota bacterium]|jgi:argininosuccinate lyase|nr:argininosuccinate lyase [Spirochaetota bacterium]OPZ34961.1 MAG: Argininosuccinate lyase 1 [Spirochaetes bacterium ADurb.BinA120]